MDAARKRSDEFWAITCYFNPAGLPSRLANFRLFRQAMVLPLMAVELAFGDAPFALAPDDAELLLQVRDGDVMWQKERLLDLAVMRLPSACRYVAWIDCDVIFGLPEWPELAVQALDRARLVQLFEAVHYLRRDANERRLDLADTYATRVSMASAIAGGARPEDLLAEGDRRAVAPSSPGFAWAMRRDVIEQCRFFDTCIVGGGDRAMIAAVYGQWDHVVRRQRMTSGHAQSFRAWGEAFRDAVGCAVSSIRGGLFHCWHGSLEKRRMRERYDEIAPFEFDPARDIGLSPSGAWAWTSDKPEFHHAVMRQFRSRYEDA